MRKIFLDLGMHRAQTMEMAIKRFPNLDLYIGVEPVLELVEKGKDLLRPYPEYKQRKIEIYKVALDDLRGGPNQKQVFYEDIGRNAKLGSSLLPDKTLRKSKKIEVVCQDVCKFWREHFREGDKILLKIDIEGKEYDVFDALIRENLLKPYVTKIYAEWHFNKVKSITSKRHKELIAKLNKLGYPVTGHSGKDEFYNGI